MKILHGILFVIVCALLIVIGGVGAVAFSADMAAPPDSIKVDTVKVDTIFVTRSYVPVQQKINEQNIKLDSIIMKLRNDQIKK